jgi:hypothetical protein
MGYIGLTLIGSEVEREWQDRVSRTAWNRVVLLLEQQPSAASFIKWTAISEQNHQQLDVDENDARWICEILLVDPFVATDVHLRLLISINVIASAGRAPVGERLPWLVTAGGQCLNTLAAACDATNVTKAMLALYDLSSRWNASSVARQMLHFLCRAGHQLCAVGVTNVNVPADDRGLSPLQEKMRYYASLSATHDGKMGWEYWAQRIERGE